MKKLIFTLIISLLSASMIFAQFRIVANHDIGNGYYPQFNSNGMVLTYSGSENVANQSDGNNTSTLSVDNSDLKLNLYRNGVKTVLAPHGSDVNYVWSSISPDGTMILFNTRKGTAICNLQGVEIANLGNLNAPVWYGSRYVVGMDDSNNGNAYTSSSIVIVSIDGSTRQKLTTDDEIAMYPTVNAENGFVAYNTIGGRLRIIKLASNNKFTSDDTKDVILVDAMPPIGKIDASDFEHDIKQPSNVRIYINPGHGGYESNDRNVNLNPFAHGSKDGFWESKANLSKALMLDSLLKSLGFQTILSRTDNADDSDRSLAAVAAEANAWNADFMLSIHSNAGSGNVNYVLQLYAGADNDDEQVYPTASMRVQESRAVASIIAENLYSNKITNWSADRYYVYGDKSYASQSLGWQDGYGVLRGLTVPGCISEGSMHDYIPETYRLMNADYRYLEAWHLAKSLYSYFCNGKMTNGMVAGQVRDKYNKLTDADYWKIRGSRDELVPLNNATVFLLKDNKVVATTQTDDMQNGVFVFRNVSAGNYTLKVEYEGYYSEQRDITVEQNQVTYSDLLLNKVRTERPEIISYLPSIGLADSVNIMTPVKIEFNTDMLADSVIKSFSISPAVEGHLFMTNSQHVLNFIPTNGYDIATEYTVTISTTACHPDFNNPNHIAQPLSFKFLTKKRAALNLVLNYPTDGAINVPTTADIALLFDQQLLNAKSENIFKLISDDSEIVVDSSMLTITHIGQYGYVRINTNGQLKSNTAYSLVINPDLADINHVRAGDNSPIQFITADESRVSDAELLNGFEDIFISLSDSKSSNVAQCDISLNEENANEGVYCNSVRYVFNDAQDEMLFLVPTYLNYIFTSKDTFMLDVYGDFSFNKMYVEFSVDGDVHQIQLCDLDYLGWKTYSLSLEELPDDISYQFTGIRIVRTDYIVSEAGEIFIDALKRVQGVRSSVNIEFENSVVVSPNPVSDMIYVRGVEDNCLLQLFTANGKLIRTAKGNEMSANGLFTNTYILRISTSQGVVIRQILKR